MKVESSRSIFTVILMLLTMVVAFVISASGSIAFAQNVNVSVSQIGDASHLEFSGAGDWKYDLKKDGKGGVVLNLAGLKPEALAKLRATTDSLISGVKIEENGVDGATQISFALAPGADFFDYITEQPSRLIVDFFPKEAAAATAEPKKAAPAAAKLPAKVSKKVAASEDDGDEDEGSSSGSVKDISAAITGRKPAASDFPLMAKTPAGEKPSIAEEISGGKGFEHGIFDGGDPEFRRFSVRDYEVDPESVFKSRGNYYLPFPMLDLGNPQLKALTDAPPSYEIVAQDTRENKEARIVLSLFSTGKRALFLTTSSDFLKKFPESSYDEIIRYMQADTFEKMWREKGNPADFEVAMGAYQSLTEKYPTSPITARTLLFMGYSFMERGDSFGALKAFQRFTRLNPTSKHLDQVNIAIAEAYLKLNRYDDSLKMLEQIENNGKTPKIRHEASFRKGDVAFRRKDWAGAIRLYRASIAKFPEAVQRFPNAFYNIAEAQFTQGEYRTSLEDYRAFLQKFPDHLHGGYAMTRMGELLGILGADPKRAQGAFMESFFRYRATPGAGVARIRSLVARMPEMKDKELSTSLKEIGEITLRYANRPKKDRAPASADAHAAAATAEPAKEGAAAEHGAAGHAAADDTVADADNQAVKKPELPGIEEFTSLLLADGYTARKEFDKATKDLISYYQKNPSSANKDRITARIKKNISENIGGLVDQGNFMGALRDYSKNSSGWLKNSDRVDVRFSVGRAYEQAGVFKEASNAYRECVKLLGDLRNSGQEREHSVYEVLPKADQLHLRLASVAAKEKNFAQAESHLKNVSTPGLLTPPEQIERAEVSADVAEARGQAETAKRYLSNLIDTWKGDASLTSPLHLRMARLLGTTKNYKDADSHLSKILQMKKDETDSGSKVSDDVFAKALQLRGDLFVSRGNRNEAIKSYRELLQQFGETRPLASVRYKLGQLLYEDGDLKAAETAWADLSPEKDGLWSRLATEQMQGAKWQNDYKKYLNRIPAASKLR